jgi:DNA-binding NarL/FixJ family response regulator
MAKISILLADDHEVVREGLRALLAAEQDMEVVAEAQNGLDAVNLVRQVAPEVVVMDIVMPVLNGLEATRQILERAPTTKVLVLTSFEDADRAAQLISAGASGYLTKRSAVHELAEAIRTVRRGKTCVSPAIAKRLRDQGPPEFRGQGARKSGELTQREAQVLQLIAEGFSNKGIAAELGISMKTVEKHRQTVMDKLNIHEIAGLTRYAISKGVVEQKPASVGNAETPDTPDFRPG